MHTLTTYTMTGSRPARPDESPDVFVDMSGRHVVKDMPLCEQARVRMIAAAARRG